jgi:hypothetical protein
MAVSRSLWAVARCWNANRKPPTATTSSTVKTATNWRWRRVL